MKNKIALIVYPHFSMQEIATLSGLFRWYFSSPTVVFSKNLEPVLSEEGIQVLPEKTYEQFDIKDYDCLILPGCSDLRESIGDEALMGFIRQFKQHPDFVIGAICSSPIYLARAGVLKDRKFTSSLFVEMIERFPFIQKENAVFAPVVEDGSIVTATGDFYREFAIAVARKVGHACSDKAYSGVPVDWKPEDYRYHLPPEEIQQMEEAFGRYLI
jgi:putative intracellular protease/amidase